MGDVVATYVVAGVCDRDNKLADLRREASEAGSREDVSTKSRWSREKFGRGSAGNEREMCEINEDEGDG